jgi:hypothetical protein
MAVCAEQCALDDLGPCSCQRVGHAGGREAEALGRRVEMVEMERRLASVVSAADAPASRLGDQLRLQAPAPSRHGLCAAALAAVAAITAEHVVGRPMAWTDDPKDRTLPVLRDDPRASERSKAIDPQPVAHCGGRAVECHCDLADRLAFGDVRREDIAGDSASWGVGMLRSEHERMFAPGPDGTAPALLPRVLRRLVDRAVELGLELGPSGRQGRDVEGSGVGGGDLALEAAQL